MKRFFSLLLLSLLLSFCLLFTACNGDETPADGGVTDGGTTGGENEDTSHLSSYGDNVVDFDTIA